MDSELLEILEVALLSPSHVLNLLRKEVLSHGGLDVLRALLLGVNPLHGTVGQRVRVHSSAAFMHMEF